MYAIRWSFLVSVDRLIPSVQRTVKRIILLAAAIAVLAIAHADQGKAAEKWDYWTEAEISALPRYMQRAARETRNISDVPVLVTCDRYSYEIPMNYFTPYGNQGRLVTLPYCGLYLFLPDLSGYTPKRIALGLGESKYKYRVEVSWGRGWVERRIGGREIIARSNQSGMYEQKPSRHEYGLDGYRQIVKFPGRWESTIWLGRSVDGAEFSVTCNRSEMGSTCTYLGYHPKQDFYLYFVFDGSHLPEWHSLQTGIIDKLMGWRAAGRAGSG